MNTTYTIMKYIPRGTLEAVCPGLSDTERIKIAGLLTEVFSELRTISFPIPGVFGSLRKMGLYGALFWKGRMMRPLIGCSLMRANPLIG